MLKLLLKIKFIHIFWFLFYFFLFSLLLRGSFSYLDPDLGWHLKVGQEITQTQTIPQVNHYNYTFNGNWVDHEWLSNWGVYQIYQAVGYQGLAIIFSLLIIISLILLNIFVYRVIPQKPLMIYIVFFQTIGLIAALPHFGVRIQELALLFLLGLLIIIYYYSRTKKWWLLISLVPLFYLWACLHASFLVGLFILFAWILIKITERVLIIFKKFNFLDYSENFSYREILLASTFFILALAVTFFTPYRQELYAFLSGYGNTVYLSYIQEWFSQFSYPFIYWQLIYLAIVATAIILYFIENRKKINLWAIFLIIVFFLLSFKSRRHFPLLFIISFVFLVKVYSDTLGFYKIRINRWLKFYLLFCLLIAISWQWLQIKPIRDPFFYFNKDYPVGATRFLENNPEYLSVNILNDYVWGGYLIWIYPEKKIFIDGRLPQVEFAGHTFLEEYLDFYQKDANIKENLSKYDVGLILIKSQDKELRPKKWEKLIFSFQEEDFIFTNYLREYLLNSTDWQPVYIDQTAVIYLKTN